MKIFLLIALVVLFIAAGPLITIWSLNTLFNLSIVYSFSTWFAVLWIFAILNSNHNSK